MLRHVGLLGAIVPAFHIILGYLAPLWVPPVPQKIRWDCEWVNMFTGSWSEWLSKWTTLLVVTGAVLSVAGMAVLIVLSKMRAGNRVTGIVFSIVMWTGILIALVTLILPRVSFIPCNPFH